MRLRPFASVAAACVAGTFGLAAQADAQAPAPANQAPAAAAPAAPSTEIDLPYGIKVTGHVEAGVSFNPDSPENNINFGQTFTDQANSFRMNQLTFAIERDLDPKNSDYQWGFRFQPMFGTDARVTHFMNEFDRATSGPYQFDILEADVQAHLPWWFGGTDVKLGQYPTPLGYEVVDALGNPLYSHTYIFNYGLPFKHTGLLTTTHVNDTLDLWLGLDTGVNDTVGQKGMANNEFPKALFGFGLNNLLDGNLTILALSHIGPENPRFTEPLNPVQVIPGAGPPTLNRGANSAVREYFDTVISYKINDSWNSVTELNYVHDDLGKVSAGGVAQYLTYALSDTWSITGRAEIFADQGKPSTTGFAGFACDALEPLDYANGQRGLQPNISYCGSGANYNVTYGAITIGANYKPALTDMANVVIRPEIRYDTVVGGSAGLKPFDVGRSGAGTKTSQFTLAVDAIIGF